MVKIIDGYFDNYELREVLAHWPDMGKGTFEGWQNNRVGSTDEKIFGEVISNFCKINFQSQSFITMLEEISGIKGLVLDPWEIGLHEIKEGGFLAPHVDYPINERTGLKHSVNALLYLNECGGGKLKIRHLEVEPKFNRLVIFTVENALHEVTKVTEGSRKSIALNYFTCPKQFQQISPTEYIVPMKNKISAAIMRRVNRALNMA